MLRRLNPNPESDRRIGFTIVEIIMAFLIIGILTAVLTPMLVNRVHEAKINTATQDLKSIGDAQERAGIDTGYFYRMYVLNDLPGGDGMVNAYKDPKVVQANQQDRYQGLRDLENTNNNLYEKATFIFVQTKGIIGVGQQFVNDEMQQQLYTRLTKGVNAETNFNWNGPYLNWSHDVNHNDWPDDPWGNDYLFFTKKGVMYPPLPDPEELGQTLPTELTTDYSYGFRTSGPEITVPGGTKYRFPAENLFDRPTILSLGPDGLPGNGSTQATADNFKNYGYGKGDDIFYQFGGN